MKGQGVLLLLLDGNSLCTLMGSLLLFLCCLQNFWIVHVPPQVAQAQAVTIIIA